MSHKPHDAPSLAYQRPLANPQRARAYTRPFRPFLEVQPGCSITLDGGCSPQDAYADLIFLLQSAITLPVFKCSTGQVPIRIERSPLSLQPGYSRTHDGDKKNVTNRSSGLSTMRIGGRGCASTHDAPSLAQQRPTCQSA